MESKGKGSKATPKSVTLPDEADKNILPADEEEDVMVDLLETILTRLEIARKQFHEGTAEHALTDAERRRLQGSGVRRYGFIDKVSDIALANPEFIPPFMSEVELKRLIRIIEILRNISVTVQQLNRITNDELLIYGDAAFQEALKYYNSVRDASRRRVPDAQPLFRILQQFFRRPRLTSDKPTEQEVERDVKALLHGKKDGKIVIENEKPHVTGGKHVVLDETRQNKGEWKETEQGEISE